MTTSILKYAGSFLIVGMFAAHGAPLGSAFTYQGRLNDGGVPVNGTYDLRFILYNADAGGSQVGPIRTNAAASVVNGLFTAPLDFGVVFDGNAYWLEISVRTNGSGAFVPLNPRQPLAATPYAQYAPSAGTSATAATASSVGVNAVTSTGIADGAVTGVKIANGTIAPVDLDLGSFNTTFWRLSGNAGATPGVSFLGSTDNQPVEFRVNNGTALRLQPSIGIPHIIGGSLSNSVDPGLEGSTIAGGGLDLYPNTISASYGAIGGGTFNKVGGAWTTIAGGRDNNAFPDHSTVAGGRANVIGTNASYGTIAGGLSNTIQTNAQYAAIGGGNLNTVQTNASYSFIGGGVINSIQMDSVNGTIGGGGNNRIQTNSPYSVVAGGSGNTIQPNVFNSIVGGGNGNVIQQFAYGAVIAGGQQNSIQTGSFRSVIGGGALNRILSNSQHSAIGGGFTNSILDASYASVIGGGVQNIILTNSYESAIVGGRGNAIQESSWLSAIGGGDGNVIESHANNSVIGGGFASRIQSNSTFSVIGGGLNNLVQPNAAYSTIAGGEFNSALGSFATLPGGNNNSATNNAFAAGTSANAIHDGAFVWSDHSSGSTFPSTADNTFNVRANGGVRFVTGAAGMTLNGQLVLTGPGGAGSGINADQLDGLDSSAFWKTRGNAGTTGGDFLGTTDSQPLDFKVNGLRAFRLVPNGSAAATVIGGSGVNAVDSGVVAATIAGGESNKIRSNALFSAIGGGSGNTIQTNSYGSFMGGGVQNTIHSNSYYSVVGGGYANSIQTNAFDSTIGGGFGNSIYLNANDSTIGGGLGNIVSNSATFSVIGGGTQNTAAGGFSTVPGGYQNIAAGQSSFAAGRQAQAIHAGTFVWADNAGTDFPSTTNRQFAVRANNGVMISATNTALDLRGGGAIRVAGSGLGATTPVFIHRATAANISGNYTVIDHPLANGDPNAILIVTPNWNPGGGVSGVYNNNPVGVFYIGASGSPANRWAIFNQNAVNAMPANSAYNVLIVKQ